MGRGGAASANIRLRWHGAPDLTACWLDESCNRDIKAAAVAAHAAVFHKRVLVTLAAMRPARQMDAE